MNCGEYLQLQSELDTARGEWIYFRLTGDNRAPGVTETKSKEMIDHAREKMEEIKGRISGHIAACEICSKKERLA